MAFDERAAAQAVEAFLAALGHSATANAELAGTGERVAKLYFEDLLEGHRVDTVALLREGVMPAENAPLVAVRNVKTHLVCPHHLTVGSARASVVFEPSDRIVGLGALTRLVEAHTRRLVLQEDAAKHIVADLLGELAAKGAACLLEARHGCLEWRRPYRHNTHVRTLLFGGCFEHDAAAQARALALLTRR